MNGICVRRIAARGCAWKRVRNGHENGAPARIVVCLCLCLCADADADAGVDRGDAIARGPAMSTVVPAFEHMFIGDRPVESRRLLVLAEPTPGSVAISARDAAATERAAADASLLIEPFGNGKRCQILFYAESHPGLSIGSLSSLLACSVSVVSQYVGQLERQGWLSVFSAGRRRLVYVADGERLQAIRALRRMASDFSAPECAGERETVS